MKEQFKLRDREVISFVGAGGKTTTIEILANELAGKGYKVLFTTSTAILKPTKDKYNKLFIGSIPMDYIPEKGTITVFGEVEAQGKLKSNNIALIDELINRNIFDYVLIEADGSNGKPIKAPNENEPVISDLTTITVGVVGLSCLGKRVDEIAHRPEILMEVLGVTGDHLIDNRDIYKLAEHKDGLFKNSRGRKILYLVGADDPVCLISKQQGQSPIIIRGGGDIASGVAHRLYKAGFNILILEIDKPLSIRRKVSFCEAIYNGSVQVEGVTATFANNIDDIYKIMDKGEIPVYIDKEGLIIKDLKPIALVDCIIAKKNLGTNIDLAPITIGVGPGFTAGVDVHLVVESMRGHNLGKVIYSGSATPNTGIPATVLGYGEERVIRATRDGVIKNMVNIGDMVSVGTPLCAIKDNIITANISGVVRGLIKEGTEVFSGLKIGDIDPRGIPEYVYTISDKARAIGGGVLEAIMYMMGEIK